MCPDVLLHLRHDLCAVIQRGVGLFMVKGKGRLAAQQLLGGQCILPALGDLQNVRHRAAHGPVDLGAEIVVKDLPGGLQGGGQRGLGVLALLQGQQRRKMLQIHADHAAGTVFGQRFSRHAGDAGAQGEQLLGRKLRGADAAQRHDILRGVEVQPQLGTLAVKGGAVGQQTAVQLQKQPVAVAVHAHGGGSGGLQPPLLLHSGAGLVQRGGQALGSQVDLDKVVHHAQPHAALYIVKFLIAGQHDEYRQGRAVLVAALRQRKTIHDRHTDVGNNDVGVGLSDGLEGLGPVAGGADHGVAKLGPIQHALHTDEDQRLIIDQENFCHGNTSFWGMPSCWGEAGV